MNLEYLYSKAKSECGYLKDMACIKVYIASSDNGPIAQGILESLQSEVDKNRIHAKVIKAGSFGYYDLEPLVTVEKPDKPTMVYNDVSPDSASKFVHEVLVNDHKGAGMGFSPISELPLFHLENRIALRNCGRLDPENINHYLLLRKGYAGLAKALEMEQSEVIEELKGSGLRGRGGAGYKTADKWKICHDTVGSEKTMICNAVDADPKSVTSRLLLESDPHSVLEGVLIGAYAVGASRCIVCVNMGYGLALERIRKALDQMKKFNLAGENILGSSFSSGIEIREIPESLVSGEETALLRFMEEKQPMPYLPPPYPAVKGLAEKPVTINASETLSHVSAIFQNDSEWFSGFGLEHCRGTKVINLSGDVLHKYTGEVDFGTSLLTIVEQIGGGVSNGKKLKAVQFGGPTGSYFALDSLDIPVDYEAVEEAGSIIGSGTIEVLASDSCMVETCKDLISYIHTQSCGQCVFCREGTYQMSDILMDIAEKAGKPQDLDLLIELGEAMKIGCICGLGRTAPNPVLSSIRLFRDEYNLHIRGKDCPFMKKNVG